MTFGFFYVLRDAFEGNLLSYVFSRISHFSKHVLYALQGDKLEIVVLNADGIRSEYMELRKD